MSRKTIEFVCIECGITTSGRRDHVLSGRKRFCGVSCANRHRARVSHKNRDQSGCRNPNYKGEEALTPYQFKLKQIEKYPHRVKARQMVHDAVRSGVLTREPCEQCGAYPTEGHHDDYNKPLQVRWLCKCCHRAIKPQIQTAAT